jgi:hypothetical protein
MTLTGPEATTALSPSEVESFDYRQNPFGLVYAPEPSKPRVEKRSSPATPT